MRDTIDLVVNSRAGDVAAFEALVREFRDMAVGYAYSILLDFHLAEDAAQEAFIECYANLWQLRDAAAFPGWFRRVVFKHCDRLTRGKRVPTVPLEGADQVESRDADPAVTVLTREMQEAVRWAIEGLPQNERAVTTLFYISGYSQAEVGGFLDIPVSTVKNRLNSAKKRLQERMVGMVQDTLKSSTPGDEFARKVADAVAQKRSLNEFLGGFPVIETKRLRLREFRPEEDARHFVTLPQVPASTPDCDFAERTEQQLVTRMKHYRDNFYKTVYVPFWAIALREDDTCIGNIRYWHWGGWENAPYAFGYIQYELAAPFWEKGIGPEALRAAGEFGIRQFGLARVTCTTNPTDEMRQKELKEAGYTDEGIHRAWYFDGRKWHDERWFSLVERDLYMEAIPDRTDTRCRPDAPDGPQPIIRSTSPP